METLVQKAADLMGAAAVQSLPSVRLFRQLFWSAAAFQTELLQRGLKDPGERVPWGNPRPGKSFPYASHFWNPETASALPAFVRLGWHASAVSEGERHFNLGVETARRILRLGASAPVALFQQAGDYLGIALHFFTDLMQPMHAACFADVFGDDEAALDDDLRHTRFEERVATLVGGIDYDPLLPELVTDQALARIPTAAVLFQDAARQAKGVWDSGLGALAKGKPRAKDPWGSEGDDYARAAFKPAAARVARLAAYFMFCARQDPAQAGLGRFQWHELADIDNRMVLASESSTESVRRVQTPERYRSLVTFVFDEQGRCSLVPCNQRDVSWGLASGLTNDALKSRQSNGAETSRFRLVSRLDQTAILYTAARIRRQDGGMVGNGDSAITVDPASGSAYADDPSSGLVRLEAQPLRLRPNVPITGYEWGEIARARPGVTLDLPWWGTPGGSPAWRGLWSSSLDYIGTVADLAVVSPGSAQLHLFAIAGGILYQHDWNGLWGGWHRVPCPAGMVFEEPLTALMEGGRLHVFTINGSSRGFLHHGTYAAGRWSWASIEIHWNMAVRFLTSCSTGPGRIDLISTGGSPNLQRYSFDGNTWGSWSNVTSGLEYSYPISAASFIPGRIDVVDVFSGYLRQTILVNNTFSTHAFLPAFTPAQALLTSWDPGRLAMIAVAFDGRVALSYWNGSWSPWQYGARAYDTPGLRVCAASWGPYRVDLIFTDSRGTVRQREYC